MAKEDSGNHIDHIAKESAKQYTPDDGGYTAVHKHLQRLFHGLSHSRELFDSDKTAEEHDQTISCIRKHHTKQENIKCRHDRGRIDLSLFRQTEGCQYTFCSR